MHHGAVLRDGAGCCLWTLAALLVPCLCFAQPGIITTVAGITGSSGFAGDGGLATSARLSPDGVAVDASGNVYTAESGNHRIRKINAAGIINTIAGTGSGGYSGDGGPGISAALSNPMRVGVDAAGNAYFPVLGGHIRKVTTAGTISTVAGGALGFSGDGGPAIRAGISQAPFGVAVDRSGDNFYFADSAYNRIRKVNADGIISTIAGNGTAGFAGDGGAATSAQLNTAVGVAVDKAGNVYIADSGNARVRKIDTSGKITTVAGNGTTGYSGDGGQAISATLSAPAGVATDDAGNLYIADSGNYAVRKVDTSGKITTVAGTGKKGASGDGGAATAATLNAAADVASDGAGNLYIVDASRIRKVNAGSAGAGGGAAGPTPVISAIVDAAAYTANIAQGSVFVVKGTNLCSSGTVFGNLPYSQAPLNGVQITFTPVGGGSSAGAYMVYTYASGSVNQLAAILPSTVPAGDYNVIVTNNGAPSAAFKASVVAHKFGIITVAGSGAGRAVVQNYISPTQYDLGRYTTGTLSGFTYSPSHPGQIIVIWGTGIGPITSPDNVVPGAIDLGASLDIQVLIDGVAIKPDLYAGRAPSLPGADEIVLTLPANVSTGCLLTLQVSVNGQLSNLTNIAVASGSDSACTAPGITTAQLAKLDQGGDFKVGTLSLAGGADTSGNTSIRVDTAGAIFVSVNTGELTAVTPAATTPVPNNSCVVTRRILTVTVPAGTVLPAFSLLGPGTLTLNGPNIANAIISTETLLNARVNGVTVVNGAVLAAGTYTVTGAGGKDVGPFKTSITLSQPLVVTSTVPGTIPRSQDLTLSWTGGGTDAVTITGSSSVAAPGSTAANPIVDSGVFTCITTGDKRTFTIPASILGQLPAARGSITVSSNSQNITFTAPLTAGGNLDAGYFGTGFSNRFGSLTFQ